MNRKAKWRKRQIAQEPLKILFKVKPLVTSDQNELAHPVVCYDQPMLPNKYTLTKADLVD